MSPNKITTCLTAWKLPLNLDKLFNAQVVKVTHSPQIAAVDMLSSGSGDPGIICFQHCISKVFCLALPDVCPTCRQHLNEKDLKLLPFRLPYPFVRASQHPCSIVLRPTIGDFLNDYNNTTDLHIALTTSRGTIVEFDRNGLQRHSTKGDASSWNQSLLVETVPEPWHELWDSVLMQICKQSHWTVEHYNEETYNCYTFVLSFLQALCYDKLSRAAQSKTSFCEKYIVPRTTTAGKYISLFRKIRDNKVYTHAAKESLPGPRGNPISKLSTIEE